MGPYDLIVMRHVLEHLPDPWATLEAAVDRLRPGGVLYVCTPNPQALQLKVLGGRWPHLDAPRHLNLIPEAALIARAESLGCQIVLRTQNDKGGRDCNAFGWEHAFMSLTTNREISLVLRAFGRGLSILVGPIERRYSLGTAYTAVFVKRKHK